LILLYTTYSKQHTNCYNIFTGEEKKKKEKEKRKKDDGKIEGGKGVMQMIIRNTVTAVSRRLMLGKNTVTKTHTSWLT